MTDSAQNKGSQNAVLALLTALLGVESAGALRGTSVPSESDAVAAQVKENAALIRSVVEEQKELHFAIKTLSHSVEDLASAVQNLPRSEP